MNDYGGGNSSIAMDDDSDPLKQQQQLQTPKKNNTSIKFTQSSTAKFLDDEDDQDDNEYQETNNSNSNNGLGYDRNESHNYNSHSHHHHHHHHHAHQHNNNYHHNQQQQQQQHNQNQHSNNRLSGVAKKQGFTFNSDQKKQDNNNSIKKDDETDQNNVEMHDDDTETLATTSTSIETEYEQQQQQQQQQEELEKEKSKPIDYDDEEGYIDPPFDFAPKFSRGGIGYDDRLPYPFVKQKHKEETAEFEHRQILCWIKTSDSEYKNLNTCDLESFLVVGDDDELPPRDEFCPYEKIEELEDKKSTLTDLDRNCFVKARARSNPYEWIKGAIFQNRAAVKMANLDKIATLIEIKPNQDKFYFADVCAGPGGFTEYTLWRMVGKGIPVENKEQRKRCKTKGWGFTLKGECDWKLDKFTDDSGLKIGDNFVVDYGPADDGDIQNEQNIRHFTQMVLKGTNQKGVNLFMADGGISTEGEELNQESILGHLILCQFLTMFEILSLGGNFVCKIFDTFTPFTVGLLYIIFKHFESFTIVKPFTSRPLNSERYVIAKNLLVYRPSNIRNYLYKLNQRLNDGENILRIIDIKDPVFIDFIRMKSLEQCDSQIRAFEYFTKAVEDWEYRVCDQEILKQNCLTEWGIPLDPRHTEKLNKQHHHPYNQQQRKSINNKQKINNNNNNNNKISINNNGDNQKYKNNDTAKEMTTSTTTTTTPVTSPQKKGINQPSYVKSPSKQFVSSLDAITKHKIKPFSVVGNKTPPLPSLDSDFQNM
ncbi:D111/G-patch domain-containing protein [Heterostelium album PN500]|uniref:Cap-specific mRNA (nucleoside-2'-O-)-methyltransferase 1 n=1 Tax=Heterostelium pallidum (strain ATCC 26659 / Pp 5 / PN500) TaxID=670386 RepID=D3B0J3_HETP5|nr:D111/G-patch domain-containing protein [Heterostelium album PN500]EFA84817.1 D111/G-patch domain-containing protein [Heterostelium album PN500]|eukprot:XP_020436928.1 D111/G-patch domain-containing protein [Heterostelium album PN500]